MDEIIRELKYHEIEDAIKLIHVVFEKFIQEEYDEEGIVNFLKFTSYTNMKEEYQCKGLLFLGAFIQEQIVGVIAIREYEHICLLFVDDNYQNKGIATSLIGQAEKIIRQENFNIASITVNSSPYAKEFYHKVGFFDLDEMQKIDGIKFIPMRKNL